MKYQEYKNFNINNRRPNVLFLGNGLFYNDCNWDEFIDGCLKKDIDLKIWNECKENIPYSVRAGIGCDVSDKKRWNKYLSQFERLKRERRIYQNQNILLERLLDLPFDAIITTNYTYQIENCLDKNFVQRSEAYIRDNYFCCTTRKRDPRFLLHSYNRVKGCDIWHMHGESRLKSSIILTHDEYGRLNTSVLEDFRTNSNKYCAFSDHLKMKTWLDYLIVGNVYALGYGADFSEFVFWWVLGRRLREKAQIGKFIFYEPKEETDKRNNKEKLSALGMSKIIVETLDCVITDSKKDYNAFYEKAIDDIKSKIKKEKSICQNS